MTAPQARKGLATSQSTRPGRAAVSARAPRGHTPRTCTGKQDSTRLPLPWLAAQRRARCPRSRTADLARGPRRLLARAEVRLPRCALAMRRSVHAAPRSMRAAATALCLPHPCCCLPRLSPLSPPRALSRLSPPRLTSLPCSHPATRGGQRQRQTAGHSALLHRRRAGPQDLAGASLKHAAEAPRRASALGLCPILRLQRGLLTRR